MRKNYMSDNETVLAISRRILLGAKNPIFFNPLSFFFSDGWRLRWGLHSGAELGRVDWTCNYSLIDTGFLSEEKQSMDKRHLQAALLVDGKPVKEMTFVQWLEYYSPPIRFVLKGHGDENITVQDMITGITEMFAARNPRLIQKDAQIWDLRVTPSGPCRYGQKMSVIEDDSVFFVYFDICYS